MSDAEFRKRAKRDACLALILCEHIWTELGPIRLGSEEFETIGGEEVPSYEDDAMAVLLRRTSDGQVFEAGIDVTIRPVREVKAGTQGGGDGE